MFLVLNRLLPFDVNRAVGEKRRERTDGCENRCQQRPNQRDGHRDFNDRIIFVVFNDDPPDVAFMDEFFDLLDDLVAVDFELFAFWLFVRYIIG